MSVGRLLCAAVVAVLLAGCGVSRAASEVPTTSRPTTTTAPAPAPPDARFVGRWDGGCCGLTIDAGGGFRFGGRTYVWCDEGPPPCDSAVGDEIHDGALAHGAIMSRSDTTAVARVASTTDTAFIPRGTVSFVLNPSNDTLTIRPTGVVLCGPAAPPLTCGA